MVSCTKVFDGDTYVSEGATMQLADIVAPGSGEFGYALAKSALQNLIENHIVWENVGGKDQNDRWVCVTFVPWNITHFVNVNRYMVENGFANESDSPNEFGPSEWELYVPKDDFGWPLVPEFSSIGYFASILLATSAVVLIVRRARGFLQH